MNRLAPEIEVPASFVVFLDEMEATIPARTTVAREDLLKVDDRLVSIFRQTGDCDYLRIARRLDDARTAERHVIAVGKMPVEKREAALLRCFWSEEIPLVRERLRWIW